MLCPAPITPIRILLVPMIIISLITAEKKHEKVIEVVQAGITEYLVKPVKSENLSNKIKEVVFWVAA